MASKDKFDLIYHQYYKLLYNVAYSVLRDHEDTQDVLQETFLCIAKNLDKISDPICPKTKNFTVIICKNNALSLLRKRNGVQTEELSASIEDGRTEMSPERAAEERSVLDIVGDAVRELPDRYRDCLYLSLFHECTPKEIASLLQLREQTVYKRLKRGKKKLKEKLEERGLTYED